MYCIICRLNIQSTVSYLPDSCDIYAIGLLFVLHIFMLCKSCLVNFLKGGFDYLCSTTKYLYKNLKSIHPSESCVWFGFQVPNFLEIHLRLTFLTGEHRMKHIASIDYCRIIHPPVERFRTLQFRKFEEICVSGA